MKKQTNPFPALTRRVIESIPERTIWEGDGRIIQVLAVKGRTGYTVTIGGIDTHYPNAEQVLAAIADVPPVTGSYEKAKSLDSRVLWQSSGGIPVRRMLVGNRGRSEY